jgi:hypothetical protein
MPRYGYSTDLAASHAPPRHVEPAEHSTPLPMLLALPLTLFWPTVIGVAFGLSIGILDNDTFGYVKYGAGVGGVAGCVISTIWLLMVLGVHRLFAVADEPVSITYSVPEPEVSQVSQPEPERIRIVPYKGAARLIDGVPEEDLRHFIERIAIIGHSQKTWRGKAMPSGATCDPDYWARLCAPLRRVGIIDQVKPRSSGVLTVQDADEIKERLGLTDLT